MIVVMKGHGCVHLFEEERARSICIERQIIATGSAQKEMVSCDLYVHDGIWGDFIAAFILL